MDKLYKLLMSDNISKVLINNIDTLIELIPEIKYIIDFEHKNPHHHLDVWEHTLYALSLSNKDFDIRLSLLLHDIGKPFSCKEDTIRHYTGHPIISSNMSRLILSRLNFDEEYIEKICFLVRYHDTIITTDKIKEEPDLMLKLYQIQYCDALAHHPDKLENRKKYLENTKKKLLKYKEVKQ